MQPSLLILAAGMGSRFGGLKQISPVGPNGELIIEYSVWDALRAGFVRIVPVIRREMEKDFRELVGRRLEQRGDVVYAFQEAGTGLPAGRTPAARRKPWGTGHALLAGEGALEGPFAVINADDFYGARGFHLVGDALRARGSADPRYVLAGYRLADTLSEHGSVSRGLCRLDAAGRLAAIDEVGGIERAGDTIRRRLPDGGWAPVSGETIVSMNFWGFTPAVFAPVRELFTAFLERSGESDTAEFYLPTAIGELVRQGRAEVECLAGAEGWFGLTHKEDLECARRTVRDLIDCGVYPERL